MGKKIDHAVAEKAMLKAGFATIGEYPGAKTPWKSKCINCKRISTPTLHSVKVYKTKCAFCSKVRVDPEEAKNIMLNSNLLPLEDYPGSSIRWKCRCLNCKTTVFPRYSFVKQGKGGCINCGRSNAYKTIKNSYLTKLKNKIRKLDLVIIGEYSGTASALTFQCNKCLRQFERKPDTINKSKYGCPFCSGYLIDDETARQKFISKGYEPIGNRPSAGFGKWKSIHIQCGRTVYPTLSNISQGYGACRYCAKFGIDMLKEAFIYFMLHKELNSYKVGIGGATQRSDRIQQHRKQKWELISKWDVKTGEIALEIEANFFYWIRKDLGIPVHLEKTFMKQGGWTETINADSVTDLEITQKIDRLIKGYRNNP